MTGRPSWTASGPTEGCTAALSWSSVGLAAHDWTASSLLRAVLQLPGISWRTQWILDQDNLSTHSPSSPGPVLYLILGQGWEKGICSWATWPSLRQGPCHCLPLLTIGCSLRNGGALVQDLWPLQGQECQGQMTEGPLVDTCPSNSNMAPCPTCPLSLFSLLLVFSGHQALLEANNDPAYG